MLIIKIKERENGQHLFESQSHRKECWMEGYVSVPSDMEDTIISCSGYGDLTTDNGKFVDFVPRYDLIPETTPEPSQLDRVEAQATYTAMMTDTLLEE